MTVIADVAASPPGRGGYVGRHWRGELSLPQSYWENGVLIGLPFNIYFRIVSAIFKAQPAEDPLQVVWWLLVPFLLMQPVAVWQLVGVWRSAGNRIRAGMAGWAWTARVMVIVGVVAMIYGAVVTARTSWSIFAAYREQQTAHYTVNSIDDRVVFSGLITPASADRLVVALRANQVKHLVVRQSRGGYILPALRVAGIIRDRHLTVIVLDDCASACTVLLAAGSQRLVSPTTVISLHTGFLAGTNDRPENWNEVEEWYTRAGMQPDLLQKVRQHAGPRDLYEPTLNELVKNGLATHIFDSRLRYYVPADDWCARNAVACARTGSANASLANHSNR